MRMDRLNRWLTLAANIGVMIGLIFLVIEVRHSISLSESQAYRSRGTEIQEAYKDLAFSADLASIIAKTNDEGVTKPNITHQTLAGSVSDVRFTEEAANDGG